MADFDAGSVPSVIIPPRPNFFKTKQCLFMLIILGLIGLVVWLVRFDGYLLFSPQQALIKKQTKMIMVNQNLDEKTAQKKAKEELQRQETILNQAKEKNITVSQEEIDKEAQRLISLTSQQTVQQTLNRYGWNDQDWKRQLYYFLLEKKLQETNLSWRDYQMLAIRWDDYSKPQLPSEDQAWQQTKVILEKARLRLEKKKI